MFISHENKFVILRNRKCASTSLVNLVEPYCEINWKTSEETLGLNYSTIRHYNAKELVKIFDEKKWNLNEYSVIQTIRNPWDRAVSAYHYEKDKVKNKNLVNVDFNEYIETKIFKNFAKNNNFDAVSRSSEGERLIPTHILKVETLDADLAHLASEVLHITFDKIEVRNTTKRGKYLDYYNDVTKDVVAELFSSDIKYGNYVF